MSAAPRNVATFTSAIRGSGTARLSCCGVACHGTDRSLFTISLPTVGNEGAALPHRPRLACGRVLCRLQFELGINLGAKQDDVERDVKPEQQDDDGAKRPVEPVVVGEVRYVERETGRGDQPKPPWRRQSPRLPNAISHFDGKGNNDQSSKAQ